VIYAIAIEQFEHIDWPIINYVSQRGRCIYIGIRAVETHFKKPRFLRFFKKPKNLKSGNLRYFRFLIFQIT